MMSTLGAINFDVSCHWMLSGCIVRQWRRRQRARITAAKRQHATVRISTTTDYQIDYTAAAAAAAAAVTATAAGCDTVHSKDAARQVRCCSQEGALPTSTT
eukprot:5205-Heterococcus_DN1.PRE.4